MWFRREGIEADVLQGDWHDTKCSWLGMHIVDSELSRLIVAILHVHVGGQTRYV